MASRRIAPDGQAAALPLTMVIGEQATYSASNFALAALGGKLLDVEQFGRFALVILAISIAVNGARAVFHEPDLSDGDGALGPSPPVLLGSAAVGLLVSVASANIVTLALVGATLGVVQDRARFVAISRRRLRPLFVANICWLGIVAFGFVIRGALATPEAIVRLWLIGAAVATLVPLIGEFGERARRATVASSRRVALFGDFAMAAGMTQIGSLFVALLLPWSEVADLRGAIIIYGVVGVITSGLTTWIFANLDPNDVDSGDVARKAMVLGGLGLAVTAVSLLTPDRVGEFVMGSAWPSRGVLGLIGLTVATQTLSTPAMMVLRLIDERVRLLQIRAAAFAGFVVSTSTLAVMTERALFVAAAYAMTNTALVILAWVIVRRRIPDKPRPVLTA